MVYRVYVEKKENTPQEIALKEDIVNVVKIKGLRKLRIINRYDVEGIDKELFDYSVKTVFSEPVTDFVFYDLDEKCDGIFAAEYLPGQFDMRANSAAECISLMSMGEKPIVKSAKVYMLYGNLSEEDILKIKKYVINPVEARQASLDKQTTLKTEYALPEKVKNIDGFREFGTDELNALIKKMGLAMDIFDIEFCREYFVSEGRDPTVTEIKMIDTYWSDHCRHTTFLTTVDSVKFEDELLEKTYLDYLDVRKRLSRNKKINFMDIATIAAKYLKSEGKLQNLDESEEINACTVKIDVDVDGNTEKWLLLFKNETHNHPTEIEPFGGAATCIGGAIRDPLSGRSYVYAAMRVTGAGNPLQDIEKTLPGKLPQRKIVLGASDGYSSYGNQIGIATGQVCEIYHEGYVAKRLETGAVIAAAPCRNVQRKKPVPGDVIILLGGKTGRDGCGGATGSSKSHTALSLENCGAEVQKGNAPEERKIQRLFRNPNASLLIKRCNDFGAGGVSVAIGELADGIDINLDAVPKKYDGLDGTELAISESQERMAVVVAKEDAEKFRFLAESENLQATVVACVKEAPYLTMRWNGQKIVNLKREFLNSNGAEKHTDIVCKKPENFDKKMSGSFSERYLMLSDNLNICSQRGLCEKFDSTIGSGTVLMPFGGIYQRTPVQAMVHKIPVGNKHTDTCSFMSYGYNPFISEKSPYHGAYLAVVESISKLIAAGADFKDIYLTFQEYFEKPGCDKYRWGKPLSALLGAYAAQRDFEIASIGGKDSMSGSFENIDVPPTLISFAVTSGSSENCISGEFKKAGSKVVIISPKYGENNLPCPKSQRKVFGIVSDLIAKKKVLSAYTPVYGGVAEAVMKMCMGNKIGFKFSDNLSLDEIFGYRYGSFLLELSSGDDIGTELGYTIDEEKIVYGDEEICEKKLFENYENKLDKVYSCNIKLKENNIKIISYDKKSEQSAHIKCAQPKVLIPVFPGTNCEYDTEKVLAEAGAVPEIFVVNNLTPSKIEESVEIFARRIKDSQIIFIPGGFSGGDEPDGSGKFIAAFFRNSAVKDAVCELLEKRDGLMCGICNGFQALIKLGLVPFGKILDADETFPTLTYNTIGRHQSKLVRTRIASNKSPWLSATDVGDIFTVPVSHGEGRFICDDKLMSKLIENGQIATQYVDLRGMPTYDVQYNPNGSYYAVEGITSPDGRIFGKMGHSERIGNNLYKNVGGIYDMKMFSSAVKYFK